MFGSIKKAMVAGAVVAIGGFAAPALAGADAWDNPGRTHVSGTLSMSVPTAGVTTTCDVTVLADLSNPGGVAHGSLFEFVLGVPADGACSTNVPDCSVTATSDASTSNPWTIDTTGTDVTITNVNFTNVYSGANCALNGAAISATGQVTAQASGNTLTFTNAAGLSTSAGPAVVNGSVDAYAAVCDPVDSHNCEPDFTTPVSLVP